MKQELESALLLLKSCAHRSDLLHKDDREAEIKKQLSAIDLIKNALKDIEDIK